jgi:hypothetical protein
MQQSVGLKNVRNTLFMIWFIFDSKTLKAQRGVEVNLYFFILGAR